ncbi:hypothetical protein [Spirochaeta africana]|uniref:Uncharacterized protein n=1 Tax=Spirochaeta africana (strain ATCC 700263 / DSM 8902 / Z-7692) TaxID=889378 RepID=H9UIN7_SPIAZ|nr:hypothetical protein [Spirochaeta africana]AFG37380.1 hypothetical protein Spiaf_1305 [Spirochaeta africana DSM 8902]
MREIAGHWPGRIFLLVLLASIIGMAVVVAQGHTETAEGADPVLLFGWMTMPLVIGIVFVLVWLVAYLVYFFKFWPYR